jgi:hypothetical protein
MFRNKVGDKKIKINSSIFFAILAPLFFGAVFFTIASGLGAKLAPGAALDPLCAPGESNCTVASLATRGTSTGITAYNKLSSVGIGVANPSEALSLAGGIKQKFAANPSIAGRLPTIIGGLGNLIVEGNYAYAINSAASSLAVFNISDSAHPVIAGSLVDPMHFVNPQNIFISGQYAYVTSAFPGNLFSLNIINISDPIRPVWVSAIQNSDASDKPASVYVFGNYAYVSASTHFYIININNPAAPAFVANLDSSLLVIPSVEFVDGQYAYLANFDPNLPDIKSSLMIIDVSSSTNPIIKSNFVDIADMSHITDLAVRNNLVYATAHSSDSFVVINVASSTNPVLVGKIISVPYLHGADSLSLDDNYAFVAAEHTDTLSVIDFSSSTHPFIAATLSDNNSMSGTFGVYFSNNYLYLNYSPDSFDVINVNDPLNPSISGRFDSASQPKIINPYALAVNGSYAYLPTASAFNIVDISQPEDPRIISATTTLFSSDTFFPSIVSDGHFAYVADYFGNSIDIIDVSNPAKPVLESQLNDNVNLSDVYSLSLSGRYLYAVSDNYLGLVVIDVSDPKHPYIAGNLSDAVNLNYPLIVRVRGNYAYICTSGGLAIINISDPANPFFVGSYSDATYMENPVDVAVRGNYAYVVGQTSDSLAVIDISDPANPFLAGHLVDHSNLNSPDALTLSGQNAYVVGDNGAELLAVVDISNPAQPRLVKEMDAENGEPGTSFAVSISGDYVFIPGYYTNDLSAVDLHGDYLSGLSLGNLKSGSADISANSFFGGSLNFGGGVSLAGAFKTDSGASFGGGVLSLSANGSAAIGGGHSNNILTVDDQAKKSALQIGGQYPACLKLKNHSGWTYCTALHGVLSCGNSQACNQ